MIRLATRDDTPRLITLGAEFLVELGTVEAVKQATLLVDMVFEHGYVLVVERDGIVTGMLGFMLIDHPVTGRYSAVEAAWFVSAEHRGRREALKLPFVARELAKKQGALDFYLTVRQDRLGEHLERLGYEAVDRTYRIALDRADNGV